MDGCLVFFCEKKVTDLVLSQTFLWQGKIFVTFLFIYYDKSSSSKRRIVVTFVQVMVRKILWAVFLTNYAQSFTLYLKFHFIQDRWSKWFWSFFFQKTTHLLLLTIKIISAEFTLDNGSQLSFGYCVQKVVKFF